MIYTLNFLPSFDVSYDYRNCCIMTQASKVGRFRRICKYLRLRNSKCTKYIKNNDIYIINSKKCAENKNKNVAA